VMQDAAALQSTRSPEHTREPPPENGHRATNQSDVSYGAHARSAMFTAFGDDNEGADGAAADAAGGSAKAAPEATAGGMPGSARAYSAASLSALQGEPTSGRLPSSQAGNNVASCPTSQKLSAQDTWPEGREGELSGDNAASREPSRVLQAMLNAAYAPLMLSYDDPVLLAIIWPAMGCGRMPSCMSAGFSM
jgi:hypothetical protein